MSRATMCLMWMSALCTSSPAYAWECSSAPNGSCTCNFSNGSSDTYHILASDFVAWQNDAIEVGANAWDAGVGTPNAGANWDFVRGSNVADWSLQNWRDDVAAEPLAYFLAIGLPASSLAVTSVRWKSWACIRYEKDVIFRSDLPWQNVIPDLTTGNGLSMVAVARHEFGHSFGFEHEDAVIGVMDSQYPGGGDIGGMMRISEDEYVGLVAQKGDSSVGRNLMLAKYERTGPGFSQEIWTTATSGGEVWSGCPGDVISGAAGPAPVLAIMNGTSSATVTIRWTLSSDGACFDADDKTIGSRSLTLASNVPASVSPLSWVVPNGIAGNFRLCAKIDSDNSVAETSEIDNVVISDRTFNVPFCMR